MKCKEDGGQCGVGGYCDKCYWKEQAMVYKENLLEAKALFDKMTKPLSDEEIEYYEHLIARLFNVSIQQKVIGLDRIIRAIEERHGIK